MHDAQRLPAAANTVNLFQWLAMISMLMDHAVQIYAQGTHWMLLSATVGRLAFPIYAALVVWSTLRQPKLMHLGRLWLLAIASQYPYMLALHPDHLQLPLQDWHQIKLNVCFTLALGATWIQGLYLRSWQRMAAAIVATGSVLVYDLRMDYHWFGIALMLALMGVMLTPMGRWQPFVLMGAMVTALLVGLLGSVGTPLLAVVSVFCIILVLLGWILRVDMPGISVRPPPLLWRSFYPAHFLLLAGISTLLVA